MSNSNLNTKNLESFDSTPITKQFLQNTLLNAKNINKDTNRLATLDEQEMLIVDNRSVLFDEFCNYKNKASEKDIATLCAAMNEYACAYKVLTGKTNTSKTINKDSLLELKLLAIKDNKLYKTNGFKLLNNNLTVKAVLQCAVFKGTDRDEFLARFEPQGPLYEQYLRAYLFF